MNRPAPVFTPLPQPSPTAAYRACRAWQLTGRPGRGGPAAGTVYQEMRLTNDSGLPCTLSGGPRAVTGVRADGSLITLTRVAYGDGAHLAGPGPANLRPGQSGWLTLAYADGCPALTSGGRADYRTLLIALGGGRVRIDFPAALNLVCGLLASTFGAPAAPPPGTTSSLNVLAATVRMPATLTAGTTASYSVTVRNTSGTRLPLSPCPSYTQYLVVDAGNEQTVVVQQRFYLNCAAIRQIPAHGSVTFAMRIAVPAASGRAKYDWQLQDTDVAIRHRRHGNGPRAITGRTRFGLDTAQKRWRPSACLPGSSRTQNAQIWTVWAAAEPEPRWVQLGGSVSVLPYHPRSLSVMLTPK